jgi:hypothetical protein
MLMKTRRTRLSSDEGGAALVLFTLTLVVLFGFMALAVDSGYAFAEKRNSQNTADIAAVGAAVQAIQNSGTDAQIAAEIVAEAQRLVSENIGTVDWSACTDAEPLALTWASELSGASNCISWSEGFRRVRVRVPNRTLDTFFASVIGIDSFDVGAAAEVEGLADGLGGILPFAALTDAGNGSLLCLKTQTAQNKIPDECDPSVSGNFGYLDFSIFGGVIPGTVKDCANTGDANARLAENIAHGVDHELGPGPSDETDASVVLDEDKCNLPTTYAGLPVNGTDAKTGTNFNQVIGPGFISGTNGFPGRLTVTSASTTTFNSVSGVDNAGLWEYLTPTASATCATLPADTENPARWDHTAALNSEAGILSCIAYHVANSSGPIFEDLADSPRFGAVPLLHKPWPPGGSADRTFAGFVTVFVQTLFGGNCTDECSVWFEPGGDVRGGTITGVTAIAIPDSVVSPQDLDAIQGLPEIEEYLIVK